VNSTDALAALTGRNTTYPRRYVVTAVTGDTVSLDAGDGNTLTGVECLNSYTNRTVGDVVRALPTSPVALLVLGSVPAVKPAEPSDPI